MNRLILAGFSVFALKIATPMQEPIAATPPVRDLNPQVLNIPAADYRDVNGC